jgi:acetyl-CoA carboxylase carboxyltransferase component
MPGREQEHKGLIRHGAKLVYAYSEATTLKLTVVLRKAYGGAYIAMSSRNLRADFVFAWPTAELAVMGADGAVAILYKKKSKAIDDPEERNKYMETKLEEYKAQFSNARISLEEGYVDELIEPEQTREKLYSCISLMQNKHTIETVPKKHGNIPL